MKNIIKYFAAALSIAAVAGSCQKENYVPEAQDGPKYIITASMDDELTKAVIADGESVKWAKGDVVKLAAKEGNSPEFTVGEDGLTELTLTATGLTAGTDFVLLKTNHDNKTFANTEIKFPAEQTQAVAGEFNSDNIVLQSAVARIPALAEGEESVVIPVKMNIVGSLYRFIPYTTQYNGEKIMSISFISADKNIAGNGAVIGKDYNTPELYRQVDRTMGAECVIFWDATSKEVKTTLGTPFDLSGVTSAETSKGIYMSLAPISMAGYKYIVRTDVATYTFDATDAALQIAENELKNVLLNLDKASLRVADADVRGELIYEGGIAASYEVSGYAAANDLFYHYARIKANGAADYTTMENNVPENAQYYDVDIKVTAEDGNSCDWLTVDYGEGSTHVFATTLSDNTGSENRVANVVMKYPAVVDGYATRESDLLVNFQVIQKPASTREISFWGGLGSEYTKEAKAYINEGLSYWVVKVDNADATDWANDTHNEQAIYGGAQFKMIDFDSYQSKGINGDEITWAKAYYKKENSKVIDTWWMVDIEENTGVAERKCVIVCIFPELDGYSYKDNQNLRTTILVQKGNISVEAALNNVYADLIPAAGGTIDAATLSLTANGENQSDVAAAMTTYGVSVTANKGASCSVAGDGTISLTVPENKYKNGGVEYTVTVKWDGKTLATATVRQEEGAEEVVIKSYSYSIQKSAGNESGTGFGFDANRVGTGNYIRISDITLDGASVDLTDDSVVAEIVEQAVDFINDESFAGYPAGYVFASREQIDCIAYVRGEAIELDFKTVNANGKKTCFVWYNADGTEAGRWYLWA